MPGGSKMAPAMHRIEIHIYRIAAAVSIWLAAAGTQCLKITKKVAFNIASEASCVLKMPKMVHFGEPNRDTRQVNFNRTRIGGKCQN